MDVIKLTNLYILCLVASDKMSDDRAWMYTGHPNENQGVYESGICKWTEKNLVPLR